DMHEPAPRQAPTPFRSHRLRLRLPALLGLVLTLAVILFWWLSPRPSTQPTDIPVATAPTPTPTPAPAPAPATSKPAALPDKPKSAQTPQPQPRVRHAAPAPAKPPVPAAAPVASASPPPPGPPQAESGSGEPAVPVTAPQLAAVEPIAPASAPLATPTPPPRALIPAPLRLKYRIHGKVSFIPYRAHGELLWTHNGQDYQTRLELGAFLLGTRVIDSQGRITADGLQPRRFGDRIRDARSAEFHYDKAEVRFSEGAPPAPLLAGAQDQLSIFIQLASLIGAAPSRYPAGSQIEFQTIGVYGSDDWRFIVNAQEHLKLPGGEADTLKLTHPPRHKDEPKVELWLSPVHGWLPLRIRLSQDNGDFIDQLWQSSEKP
ncbi:MAG: DUF3108 domain-containing protein, partial [Hylemonella sp.]|nr:DUF3108 domain-containing protein [Hylemonella sp.]